MANNFRIETTDSNFNIVDGTLENFVGGNGYVQLKALSDPTYPTFNLYIDNSNINFSMVKTIKFKRTIVSLKQNTSYNSNYGYYDSNNTWHYIAQNPSSVGGIMTFDNLSMPSDTTRFQFGCNSYLLTTNGEYKLEEFDILDANGNSLLESSDPSQPSTGLPLYIGDSNIQAVKLGDVNISKMYIGDTLIYGSNEPQVNNNFKIKFSSSATIDGDLEQFATGNGFIDVNTGDYTMGDMYIYKLNDNISWQDIKTLGFDRAELISPTSRGSNYPTWYLQDDSQGFNTFTNPTVSSTSVIASNINIPAYYQQIRYLYTPIRPEGRATNGVYRISNLKILDSNGNSLLKS